jgi:hypothetical protein
MARTARKVALSVSCPAGGARPEQVTALALAFVSLFRCECDLPFARCTRSAARSHGGAPGHVAKNTTNAGAQSPHAFIENNGRRKPNFSSFGRITVKPEVTPKRVSMSGLRLLVHMTWRWCRWVTRRFSANAESPIFVLRTDVLLNLLSGQG